MEVHYGKFGAPVKQGEPLRGAGDEAQSSNLQKVLGLLQQVLGQMTQPDVEEMRKVHDKLGEIENVLGHLVAIVVDRENNQSSLQVLADLHKKGYEKMCKSSRVGTQVDADDTHHKCAEKVSTLMRC